MLTSAIRDRAEARFGDSNNQVYTAQEWLDYINGRYYAIWAAHQDWPFKQAHATVTVLANTRGISLGTGVWRVQSVVDTTNDNVLIPISRWQQINEMAPNDEDSGLPECYQVYGSTIELWPKPDRDAAIKIDAMIGVTALAAGDTPVFPEQYHEALIEGALADAYLDDGNYEQFQAHEARYQAFLAGMMADLLGAREEGYTQIIDTW
jgi:hypothetical protein